MRADITVDITGTAADTNKNYQMYLIKMYLRYLSTVDIIYFPLYEVSREYLRGIYSE